MKKVITIEDVAKLSGVSRATVGRVIGNYGSVSEKSRQRVLEAIEQLNYKPNIIAQGMRGNSTKTVAVVLGDVKNNYCNALVYVVEKEAQKRGYSVIICNTRENVGQEMMHIQNMRNRKVDGIILMSAFTDEKQIPENGRELYEGSEPIVFVDRMIQGISGDIVVSNNEEISYEATMHLLKLGHRHIGVIATVNYSTIQERIRGYERALKEYGISMDTDLIEKIENFDRGEAQIAAAKLLDEHPEVTAVYVLNNSLCGGVLLELKKRKLKVCQDISLLVWDDEEINELFDITTVVQPIEEIGRDATACLFEQIKNGKEGKIPKMKTIEAKIIYRNSCRNINDR